MASPLFIFTQSPSASDHAREGIEALLACAAFDMQPEVLFLNQGVLQLFPTEDIKGTKNLNKMISAFEIYGVQNIYADKKSINYFGLKPEQISPQPTILEEPNYAQLIDQASWIMRF